MASFSLAPFQSLLRLPGIPRLVVSSLVGRVPASMGPLSVVLLVQSMTGSYAHAGSAAGAAVPAQEHVLHLLGGIWVAFCPPAAISSSPPTPRSIAGGAPAAGVARSAEATPDAATANRGQLIVLRPRAAFGDVRILVLVERSRVA